MLFAMIIDVRLWVLHRLIPLYRSEHIPRRDPIYPPGYRNLAPSRSYLSRYPRPSLKPPDVGILFSRMGSTAAPLHRVGH